jgi:serine/threonine protein kinase
MKISSVVCMIHLKGFSHRDLKLENILIDIDTLEIIISDLGFAEPIY